MLRNFFVILLFIVLCCNMQVYANYDMTTPVKGESIANDELQFLVIKKLYSIISPKTPACTDYFISNTQLLHYPYDVKKNKKGKYVKGYWKEIWSVNSCGNVKQLPITFYIKKNKANFDIDSTLLQ